VTEVASVQKRGGWIEDPTSRVPSAFYIDIAYNTLVGYLVETYKSSYCLQTAIWHSHYYKKIGL
jgi:hypothetical protein